MFTALHNLLIHFSILFLGSVDSVAPSAAAPGAPIVINGCGFGLSKPKVTLIPGNGSKPISLKVSTFSDTRITASFTKGLAGDYTLRVQPKGRDVAHMDAAAPFQISAPTEGIVTPNKADATMIVTLSANHLGPKRAPLQSVGSKPRLLRGTPSRTR